MARRVPHVRAERDRVSCAWWRVVDVYLCLNLTNNKLTCGSLRVFLPPSPHDNQLDSISRIF